MKVLEKIIDAISAAILRGHKKEIGKIDFKSGKINW